VSLNKPGRKSRKIKHKCIKCVERICDLGKITGSRMEIIGFPSNPEIFKILLTFIPIGNIGCI
jgi:hypothetical protein